jgi:PmbA protein
MSGDLIDSQQKNLRAGRAGSTSLPPGAALDFARKTISKVSPDEYEVYVSRSSATKVEAKDQKIESLTRADDVGLSVRLKRQNRVGFSFTTSLTESAIQHAVQSALEISEVMPEDQDITLGGFAKQLPEIENRHDQAGLDRDIEEKIQLAMRLERLCREADSRIQTVRSASFSESEREILLTSHEGNTLRHRATLFYSGLSCKAEEKGEAQMGYESVFSHLLSKLDVDFCARSGAESATELLGAIKPESMQCPAVIRNDVVSELLDFLSSSFSGEAIEKGKSLLQGKRGEKVFADAISILDDGLKAGGLATEPFDAEGTASQTTKLVDTGVFSSMLLDRKYAKRFGEAPTGNSARSIKSPPGISTTNLYLQPGQNSLAELIREVGDGILITNLMGVHTANPVTGNFSLGASGILIRNGKLDVPVKGFAVAGNILDLFRNVATLGNDFRFFGSVGAPSLLLPELSVSGN